MSNNIQNNFCVIMAGGIGSRFWPYSRQDKPKQFLDFFGTGKSLLQLTVERLLPLVPKDNILIVTNVQYKSLVLETFTWMKEQQVLCEPVRRNTAPCIAYAIARIKAITNHANIIIAPSDHLVLQEDAFRKTIEAGLEFISNNNALLTLGIKATRPETGYGYIQIDPDNQLQGINKVKTFTEKPNRELAEMFLRTGEFLWNSGMFLWNLDAITTALHTYIPSIWDKFQAGIQYMATPEEDAFIQDMFPSCANISIDYGLMEKANNVYVLEADFGWSDLGTWGSLYEQSEKDENGNVTLRCETALYDSHNNVIVMPQGKLAVVQGLNEYIIAESENVLLICRKECEQQIRQFVNDAQMRFNGKYN